MPGVKPLSGTWLPVYAPKSSLAVGILLVWCSAITSMTRGYDGVLISGLNILPSYTSYFHLSPATTGLGSAAPWMGGCIAPFIFSPLTENKGRRIALMLASAITLVGTILQAAAQDEAMFVLARIIMGIGTGGSGITGPVYLSETFPYNWRAWGVGLLNDMYFIGGIVAAGVCLGASNLEDTWSWRIPSLIQSIFSIFCIIIIPFIPESPRWLANKGYFEEAHKVLALTHADSDLNNPIVLAQLKEIQETLQFEREVVESMSVKQIIKTPSARYRLFLACTAAAFSVSTGNIISSYYLGTFLDDAGVTNEKTQLKINVILNAFALVCSLAGTHLVHKWGRKPMAIIVESGLGILMFMIGALTKVYGNSTNQSGIYATVACMFLFQGLYAMGWTPLLYLYPPEVLNYSIRTNGQGASEFSSNGMALLLVFTMPLALAAMRWKFYMINGAYDILVTIVIAYSWVETKGKSLEEIDAIFEGQKHSSAPDLALIKNGKADFDTAIGSQEVGNVTHEIVSTDPEKKAI